MIGVVKRGREDNSPTPLPSLLFPPPIRTSGGQVPTSKAPALCGISMSISSVETVSPRSILIGDPVAVDRDVARDHGDDFLAQHGEQIGIPTIGALVARAAPAAAPARPARSRAGAERSSRLMQPSVRTAGRIGPCGRQGSPSARSRP